MTRQHDARYTPARDFYAAMRCANCPHLFYDDDVAGGSCRWAGMVSGTPSKGCECADHRPQGPDPFDEFDRWSARVWSRLQDLGHLDCGGWSAKEHNGVVTCLCGTRVEIAEGVSDAAASS